MNTVAHLSADTIAQERDAFIERLVGATLGLFDVCSVYIGDRLGLYPALANGGSLTSAELAAQTGTQERYVREWLEQQAVAGILAVEDETADARERRFYLPPGHVETLVERDSLNFLAPLAQVAIGAIYPLGAVLTAFRNGGGVPFEDYGRDLREGQARINRAAFLQQLGAEWLPSMPDVHARLQADPPARIADIGCGAGWSSIGMAQSYSHVRVDGYDLDAPSIELARANAAETGLADRVTFHVQDASDPSLDGRYDLVTAFECVHDMSDPVGALRRMRALANRNGAVLIMDERVSDRFSAQGDEVEQMMYGWSVLHCLPVGMAEEPSAATGTVMRTDTLRGYAEEAGFSEVEVLPIDHFFFRFYRLYA